jgi:hypothetical protein
MADLGWRVELDQAVAMTRGDEQMAAELGREHPPAKLLDTSPFGLSSRGHSPCPSD